MRQLLTVLFLIIFPLKVLASTYGAEILYDHSAVKFFPDGRKTWKEEKVVKIIDKRGIKRFAEIVIPFSSEHQRLKILYAYTVLPDGKVVKPSPKAFNVTYPPFVSEAPIYSDLKYQTVSMPAVTKGAVIKYAFELQTLKPYMKNNFWSSNYFQDEYPVKEATFKAFIPQGRYYRYKDYNMVQKPKIKKDKDYIVLSWKLTDIPPIEREPNMPPVGKLAKKVVITSLRNWNQVAKWYSNLAREALKPDKSIVKIVNQITAGKKTQEEKIRAIYNFVAQNIRYVGMEFGINGYKPHRASEILTNRYGDCKDHATLLVTMLKVIGVKGYPVLIPTLDIPNMDVTVPFPTAFDHEIAAIRTKKGFLYLDTTSDVTPFGYLPAGDQGRRVLIVNVEKEIGTISETPVALPETNVEGFNGKFKLSPFGKLSGNFTFFYRGVYSDFERERLLSSTPDSIKRYVDKLASRISPGFDVENFNTSTYKNLNIPQVWIDINGNDMNYGTLTSHFLLAKFPAPDYSRIVSLVASRERKYAYIVGYRMSKISNVEIQLPPDFKLYLKPENFYFKNRVGSFEIKWKVNHGALWLFSKMVLNKNVVPSDEYGELRELFNTTVKTLRNQIIVLRKIKGREH